MVAIHAVGKGQDSLSSPDSVRYLKEYNERVGPVGARDTVTLAFLKQLNITAYLSRCMTLTLQYGCECLDCPPCSPKSEIVMNDVDIPSLPGPVQQQVQEYRHLHAAMPQEISSGPPEAKFEYAHRLFDAYAKDAKVLMTGRLHAALPSLAMGNPVIFVDPAKKILVGGDNRRLAGIFELLHVYQKGQNWTFDVHNMPPNPGLHTVDRNRAAFWNYFKRRSTFYEDTARMHGIIPLQRLGRDKNSETAAKDIFHFVVFRVSNNDKFNWLFVRAIEYVFFHHPNARVYIHTNDIEPSGTKLDIFQETGYQLEVKPIDTQSMANDIKLSTGRDIRGIISQLETMKDSSSSSSRIMLHNDILRLLILLQNGGILLSPDTFLLQALPVDQLTNVVAGDKALIVTGHDKRDSLLDWMLKQNFGSQEWMDAKVDLIHVAQNAGVLLPKDGDDGQAPVVKVVGDPRTCYEGDIGEGSSPSAWNAVQLRNSFITVDENDDPSTASTSTCDDLLHKFCILCDEIHTADVVIAAPYKVPIRL